MNEVKAYNKLRKYWGHCVPALVDFGTTAHGKLIYIATELVKPNPTGQGIRDVKSFSGVLSFCCFQ